MSDDKIFTGIIRQVEDLEGSILGEVLDRYDNGVFVAPTLGLDFVQPWPIPPDRR